MTLLLRSRLTVAAIFVFSFYSVSAQNYNFKWDGGGTNDKYENAKNWNTDSLPAASGQHSMSLLIDQGTMIFDDLSGKQRIDQMDVNNGAVLNMKGGIFDQSRPGNSIRSSIGTVGSGLSVVNQSGGRLSIGHMLRIGADKSRGQYNLTGGMLEVYRAGYSSMKAPHQPSISLGSVASESDFTVSGGSLYTRAGVEVGSNAKFSVLGSGATAIGIGSVKEENSGAWYQEGTLSCGVGPRGITKIYVAGGDKKDQFVRFAKGSKLDLHFHGTRPINGSWVLMELEGVDIVNEGLEFSEATLETPGWTVEIDNSGSNGRLIAKYSHYVEVPEVSQYSLILSLLLGVCVLGRRRRT